MRFSLGTLMLVVLWTGTLMLVWFQREPWLRASTRNYARPKDENGNLQLRGFALREVSVDKRRRVEIHHRDEFPDCVAVVENSGSNEGRILWRRNGNFYDAVFVDDDTLTIDNYLLMQTYRRRFPEWWWGHFYRPEVWCAIALSGVLIWRVLKRLAIFRRSRASA